MQQPRTRPTEMLDFAGRYQAANSVYWRIEGSVVLLAMPPRECYRIRGAGVLAWLYLVGWLDEHSGLQRESVTAHLDEFVSAGFLVPSDESRGVDDSGLVWHVPED